MRHLAIFFLASATTYTSAAADYSDCWNGNTIEINNCMFRILDRTQEKLDAAFLGVLKDIDETTYTDREPENTKQLGDVRKLMITAQAHWRTFRQADCDTVYRDSGQGTVRNMTHLQCMIARTEERIQQLKSWRDWKY